ncbi:MAG: YfhO family protein [Planctomycetota bacterium]|nr:YfhO family protein [Planctomycetota bacterium]
MPGPRTEPTPVGATVATAILIAMLPLVLLWPCVFGDRTFVPYDLAAHPPASQQLTVEDGNALRAQANYDVTEVPIWFEPELRYARQQLLEGSLPTWNPTARGGTPIHGHGLIGLCYPPNWLALLAAEPGRQLGLLAWSSMAIVGLLMFGLLRQLGLSLTAAAFGAITLQLSATVSANAYFWMRLSSLVWLPGSLWALLCIDRARAVGRLRPVAGLAITIAMPWLAGFPPYATAVTVLAGAFAATLIARRWRQEDARAAMALATAAGAGALLGVMLSMPQVLPSLQFFPESARQTDPGIDIIAGSRLDAYGLLGYLVPELFGHPDSVFALPYEKSPLTHWLCCWTTSTGQPVEPFFNFIEYSVFLGTPALLLALLGAYCGRGQLRWFAITGTLVLLAMATFAPGARLLFQLPVFQNVWPVRWLAPAAVLLAWLAALGLDRLRDPQRRRPALLLAGSATALLLFGLTAPLALPEASAMPGAIAERFGLPPEAAVNHLSPPGVADRFEIGLQRADEQAAYLQIWSLLTLALAALALFEFWRTRQSNRVAWLLLAANSVQLIAHDLYLTQGQRLERESWTEVHDFLAAQQHAYHDQGGLMIARASSVPGLPDQLPPGPLLAAEIRDLHFDTHYDARSPAPLQRLYAQEDLAIKGYLHLSLPDDERLQHPLLDLIGVRYLLATEPLQHAGDRVGPRLRGPGGEFFVYERPNALPRAFVVAEVRPLADDEAVLAAMLAPDFDPLRVAWTTAAAFAGQPALEAAPRAMARRVQFADTRATRINLEVSAGPPSWLVLADTWLPGWHATVDGKEVSVLRVDHMLRAVPVPAEACSVRFVYRAPGLRTGTILMLVALCALLSLCWLARNSRPPPDNDDDSA